MKKRYIAPLFLVAALIASAAFNLYLWTGNASLQARLTSASSELAGKQSALATETKYIAELELEQAHSKDVLAQILAEDFRPELRDVIAQIQAESLKPTQSESKPVVRKEDTFSVNPAATIKAIRQGVLNMDKEIDLTGLDAPVSATGLYLAVVMEYNPAASSEGSRYHGTPQGMVSVLDPLYTISDKATYRQRMQVLDEAVAKMVAAADGCTNDVDRIIAIHDYLVHNFSYDYGLTKYSAYDLLVNGSGACQAYTAAFSRAMAALDIACATAYSSIHSWNIVKLDGEWFHVDVTWGEGYTQGNAIDHRFILINDAELHRHDQNDAHASWVTLPGVSATSDRYLNADWRN